MTKFAEYKKFTIGHPIAASAADPDSQGYVYVIGFEEAEIVKIGTATCVGSRLASLQSGNPFELKLLAAVSIYDVPPIVVEFAAHKMAKAAGVHIRGEWFEMGVDEALECIIKAARSKRAAYGSVHSALQRVDGDNQCDIVNEEEERRRVLRVKLGMC